MQKKPFVFTRREHKFPKIAIIINGFYSAPHYLEQCNRIREELLLAGAYADIIRNDGLLAYIERGRIVNTLEAYDACVYLDKDKYLSALLEKCGMRLFNRHQTVLDCDDKMTTHIMLADSGIPMPKTIAGQLCYDAYAPVSFVTIAMIEENLGYPVVIKESYGSQGKGVYIAHNRAELYVLSEKLKMQPHLYQQAIISGMGKDVRVIVIGGKALPTAMLRRGGDGFHSNIGRGGSGASYPLTASFKNVAELAAKTLNADYCGVDLLFGDTGEPILCEVNSNAFFSMFESCTGINVAKAYTEHILSELQKIK